jgi:hypothetical protein
MFQVFCEYCEYEWHLTMAHTLWLNTLVWESISSDEFWDFLTVWNSIKFDIKNRNQYVSSVLWVPGLSEWHLTMAHTLWLNTLVWESISSDEFWDFLNVCNSIKFDIKNRNQYV